MGSVNKVILVGYLGRDPEMRYTTGGTAVANFSIATSETWKDSSGQKQESTEWHNIVAWKGLADIAQKFLTKGSQVYVEGKLKTREWSDRDGNKRRTTEIVISNLTMLGSRNQRSENENSSQGSAASEEYPEGITDSDIPF